MRALLLAAAVLPAACSSSSSQMPPTAAPASPISFSPSSLSFTGSASQTVRVSQANYSGTFTQTNSCAETAEVVFSGNAQGRARLVVTPLEAGSCSIRVAGGGGASGSVAVSVAPSPVTVQPPELRFDRTGDRASVTVSQAGFSGRFTVGGNCENIAIVERTGASRGRATFGVTSVGKGECTTTFSGGLGESASLSIAIETPSDVVATPSSLSFTAVGPGAQQSVTISQSDYGGSFTQSSDCAGIAKVTGGGSGPKVTYTVTPLAKGDCTIAFTGGQGLETEVPVTVAPSGNVVVSPWSVRFTDTQRSSAKDVTVTQTGYSGKFAETDDCAKVATLAQLANGAGKARYRVTPLAKGRCKATFTGARGESAPLAIAVAPPGKIDVQPPSLAFTATGSSAAAQAKVSQSGYTGTFAESDDCSAFASVVASRNAGGKAAYVVTPLAEGACTATFDGGNRESASLAISVKLAHPMTASPSSLTFVETGSGAAQTVTVTQSKYSGSFTESDDCTAIATVTRQSSGSGTAVYSVTPTAAGSCSATFTGGFDTSLQVPISVTPPGSVVVTPSSMTFHTTGSGAAQQATVSQHGFSGTFTESDTCSGIATVSASSSSKGTFSVAAVAAGTCVATFTGGNQEKGTLNVEVAPYGKVAVTPSTMKFTATGSGAEKTANVAQTNYTGTFAETDTCASIANVSATANYGGQAAYTVTPLAKGTCTATFTGANKSTADLSIDVAPYGKVVVTPSSMTFDTAGATMNANVTQAEYHGTFTESDDCSGTATVTAATSSSGTATFAVTAIAQGSCTATFTGGNGETAPLSILVDLPGGVVASPAPLNFSLSPSARGVTETVTQPKYTGSFTESDTCGGIVKVVELSNGSGTAQYRVTPVAVGICEIVFTGGNSETFVLHVSVSQTKIVVNGKRRD